MLTLTDLILNGINWFHWHWCFYVTSDQSSPAQIQQNVLSFKCFWVINLIKDVVFPPVQLQCVVKSAVADAEQTRPYEGIRLKNLLSALRRGAVEMYMGLK